MNKELIDKAWSVLPVEFKEEVKKEWGCTDNAERLSHDAFLRGQYQMMRDLFGPHNLTSDAEGEVILTCVKDQAVKLYDIADRAYAVSGDKWYQGYMKAMTDLFGSKCLPDEATSESASKEPKPTEPKFKRGDKVRIKDGYYKEELHGCVGTIRKIDGCHIYVEIDSTIYPATIHSLESYTEPKETFTDDCESQCKSISMSTLDPKNVEYLHIASEESHYRNLSQENANYDKSDTGFPHDAQKCGTVYQRRKMDMAARVAAGILAGSDFTANDCTKESFDKLAEISLACANAIISKTLKDGED